MAHNFFILQRIFTGPASLEYASKSGYFAIRMQLPAALEHTEAESSHFPLKLDAITKHLTLTTPGPEIFCF